ncbi:MAG: single-stranded DNA-binding protein [Verrucomicrobia bacterium]|nr:single-stranded DNA-binding protein [Verrucomicrobiota bacterium]
MAANINKVLLAGNLTRDPELKFTAQGTAIANLGIAVNRVFTNQAGEKKEDVTFVDVEAWGKTAEIMGQYLKKGRPVFIEGRLKLDQWDDKQSGQKRSKLKVVCESFHFMDSGGRPAQGEGSSPSTAATTRPAAPAAQSTPAEPDEPPAEPHDDVPF